MSLLLWKPYANLLVKHLKLKATVSRLRWDNRRLYEQNAHLLNTVKALGAVEVYKHGIDALK